MSDHFKSQHKEDSQDDNLGGQSFMIVTPEDSRALKTLLQFCKKTGTEIPSDLIRFQREDQLRRDLNKAENPLCENLKLAGECEDEVSCPFRHLLFADVDNATSNALSTGSELLYKITAILSPVHFYGVQAGIAEESTVLSLKLSNIIQQDLLPHKNLLVGSLCLIRTSDGCLKRGEIRKINENHEDQDSFRSHVLLIDEGTVVKLPSNNIYELADHLSEQAHPRRSIEIVLLNVCPPGKDTKAEAPLAGNLFALSFIFRL